MYQLPDFNIQDEAQKIARNKITQGVVLVAIIIIAAAFAAGGLSLEKIQNRYGILFKTSQNGLEQALQETASDKKYVSPISYEQAVIDSVASASPSVVSIVISKNMPIYEQRMINPFGFGSPFGFEVPEYVQKGTELKEIGAGSGFIISQDGRVLTNKHVVLDKAAQYAVITNNGKTYSAKVLALDPVQDLAIIKIQEAGTFPSIKLGNSDGIQIGQGAIAIGNALGQFSNTVSVGVISGLGRTIFASGSQGFSETLENIIQTDAAINQGNSGGPLINLKGEVIGVNTATAQGAQTIGFAIPINIAKRDINQVIKTNKITYPFLGVRYVLIDEKVKKQYKLSVDYGAYVVRGENGEVAITANSPAKTAGLKEKDVILTFNGEKITKDNSLASIIARYNPGDKVTLKVLRGGEEMDVGVTLTERK